jgi:hypothetical protein
MPLVVLYLLGQSVSVMGWFNDWGGDTLRPEAQTFLGASGVPKLAKPLHTAAIAPEC